MLGQVAPPPGPAAPRTRNAGSSGTRRSARLLRSTLPLLFPAIALASGCGGPPKKEAVVLIPPGAASPTLVETVPPTAPDDTSPPTGPARLTWQTSEDAARALAKKRALPLVVFLIAEWTVPALKMERTTWTDPRIVALADRFIALRIDVTDAGPDAQAAADRFEVQMLPTVIVLDADGAEAGRFLGFTEAAPLLDLLTPLTR